MVHVTIAVKLPTFLYLTVTRKSHFSIRFLALHPTRDKALMSLVRSSHTYGSLAVAIVPKLVSSLHKGEGMPRLACRLPLTQV